VSRLHRRRALLLLPCIGMLACGSNAAPAGEALTVFAAGSLARPLRAALDTIAATGGPRVRLEIMGSREMIRAMTMLGRRPDLLVTADADELEQALMPRYVSQSTTFARNRIVLALSPKSEKAAAVTSTNWIDMVAGGTLAVARADPRRAPLGFRTQLVWKLAEIETQRAGLAARLGAASPDALLRGSEADLGALLESGNADAAWCYESLARSLHLSFIRIGDRIDLGTETEAAAYRRASVRIVGVASEDSMLIAGAPIRYSIAVAATGVRSAGAATLRARLLDSTSRRVMRQGGLDVLDAFRVQNAVGQTPSAP
jgi:molybdate/tungstate transport system substrate-binding protein